MGRPSPWRCRSSRLRGAQAVEQLRNTTSSETGRHGDFPSEMLGGGELQGAGQKVDEIGAKDNACMQHMVGFYRRRHVLRWRHVVGKGVPRI